MSEEELKLDQTTVEGMFHIAKIPFRKIYRLENDYWPRVPDYYKIRANSPWWLVATSYGNITIGWRKRVIEICWEDTPIRETVTTDDVTSSESLVHAWSNVDAVKYLTTLGEKLKNYGP